MSSGTPKSKPCSYEYQGKHYGCGHQIIWDDKDKFYREVESGLYHSKERCKQFQAQREDETPGSAQIFIPPENPIAAVVNPFKPDFEAMRQQKAQDIKEAQDLRKAENDRLIDALNNATKAMNRVAAALEAR